MAENCHQNVRSAAEMLEDLGESLNVSNAEFVPTDFGDHLVRSLADDLKGALENQFGTKSKAFASFMAPV